MKKPYKLILASAIIATIPLSALAYDKYDQRDEHECHEDKFFMEKYKEVNYEFEGRVNDRPKNKLSGTWTISGIKVIVDDKTFISHSKSHIKVGDDVEVLAKRTNGEITALDISQDD